MAYTIVSELKKVDGLEVVTYGIHYNEKYSVSDVSTDKTAVEKLIDALNCGQLAPYQLMDVVEDFLN